MKNLRFKFDTKKFSVSRAICLTLQVLMWSSLLGMAYGQGAEPTDEVL
jgi:hypothetical protein